MCIVCTPVSSSPLDTVSHALRVCFYRFFQTSPSCAEGKDLLCAERKHEAGFRDGRAEGACAQGGREKGDGGAEFPMSGINEVLLLYSIIGHSAIHGALCQLSELPPPHFLFRNAELWWVLILISMKYWLNYLTEASTVKKVIVICFHSKRLSTCFPLSCLLWCMCVTPDVQPFKKKKYKSKKKVSLTEPLKGHCLPLCGHELCGRYTCTNGAMKVPAGFKSSALSHLMRAMREKHETHGISHQETTQGYATRKTAATLKLRRKKAF